MIRFFSALGLIAFAGLSGFHVFSLWQVIDYYLPGLAAVFGVLLALLWLGGLALMLRLIRRNNLKAPFLAVFLYVMTILLLGTRVLEGVPSQVAEGTWNDPHHRLTPDSKYVLHNHSQVIRALSEAEYRLYQTYAACYFSAGLMMFAAGLWICPLDRDGQLQGRPRVRPSLVNAEFIWPAQCPHCSGPVPLGASGQSPPWCPNCGGTL